MSQSLHLEVRRELLMFRAKPSRETPWLLNTPSVTLAELIKHPCFKESDDMRLSVSVSLARAAWQFYRSSWMESHWELDKIRFLWAPSSDSLTHTELSMGQPFLYSVIAESDAEVVGPSHSNQEILALGILLLEIALCLRLDEQSIAAELQDGQPVPNTAYLTANRLCDKELYRWTNREEWRRVIRACVKGQPFTGNAEGQHRSILLKEVVVPLEDLLKSKLALTDGITREWKISNAALSPSSHNQQEQSRSKKSQSEPPTTDDMGLPVSRPNGNEEGSYTPVLGLPRLPKGCVIVYSYQKFGCNSHKKLSVTANALPRLTLQPSIPDYIGQLQIQQFVTFKESGTGNDTRASELPLKALLSKPDNTQKEDGTLQQKDYQTEAAEVQDGGIMDNGEFDGHLCDAPNTT